MLEVRLMILDKEILDITLIMTHLTILSASDDTDYILLIAYLNIHYINSFLSLFLE